MLRAAPELILIAEDASTRKKTVGNLSECIKQAAGKGKGKSLDSSTVQLDSCPDAAVRRKNGIGLPRLSATRADLKELLG